MNESSSVFPLTALRLRFDCRSLTELDLGGLRAGMRLRGALLSVMNRSVCALSPFPPPQRLQMDPQHVAGCPVCWLQLYEPRPGQVRRAFALQPPLNVPARLPSGTDFTFAITLIGEGREYLPYFVLAVREMGEVGVGRGRGRFAVKAVLADFADGKSEPLWQAQDAVLRLTGRSITHAQIQQLAAERIPTVLNGSDRLQLSFPTPLRIVHEERLLKTPHFEAIFDALLKRLDELADLYAGGYRRPYDERVRLRQTARQVTLIENHTEWVELSSSSSRTGKETWISGLVGRAVYAAPPQVWGELIEWLVWAEVVQVGKDTVKGNGVVRLTTMEG
ncbi:MAG: CRISPR system precrRNA processing endoribonuclease RAMP protein Cas6 [Chloroflexota bacterium]|nr:MAG: CRISPR-associated protein Cas6 [Bellilinea sp.]